MEKERAVISLFAAFLIPWFIGYSLSGLLMPNEKGLGLGAFRSALALGIGLGVQSILLFVWLLIGGGWGRLFVALEAGLGLAGAIFLFRAKGKPSAAEGEICLRANRTVEKKLQAFFLLLLAIGAGIMILVSLLAPHGDWDAWAIWNLRARFLFRAGGDWKTAFSPLLAWSHPDYPLLLPLSVARCWFYLGEEPLWVPAALALAFSLATVLVLVLALIYLKGPGQGYLGGILLLSTPAFLTLGASQYADIPLSFYFLSTLTLLTFYDHSAYKNRKLLTLAGLMAGFSAWTKNEGLWFTLLLILFRGIPYPFGGSSTPRWKEAAFFWAGLWVPLAVLLIFKSRLAPVNDLWAALQVETLFRHLTDPHRYLLVAKAFFSGLLSLGNWPLSLTPFLLAYTFIIGRSPKPLPVKPGFVILILQFLGYYGVFLLTPHELRWHLGTASGRLILQLWPSFLFLLLSVIKTPEEVLEPFFKRRETGR